MRTIQSSYLNLLQVLSLVSKGSSWLVVTEIAKAAKKISVQFSYLQMLLHPRGTEHALLDNRLLQDGGLKNDIKI